MNNLQMYSILVQWRTNYRPQCTTKQKVKRRKKNNKNNNKFNSYLPRTTMSINNLLLNKCFKNMFSINNRFSKSVYQTFVNN